jgi:hypothetical protein
MANVTAAMPLSTAAGALLYGIFCFFPQQPQIVAISYAAFAVVEIAPHLLWHNSTDIPSIQNSTVESLASEPQIVPVTTTDIVNLTATLSGILNKTIIVTTSDSIFQDLATLAHNINTETKPVDVNVAAHTTDRVQEAIADYNACLVSATTEVVAPATKSIENTNSSSKVTEAKVSTNQAVTPTPLSEEASEAAQITNEAHKTNRESSTVADIQTISFLSVTPYRSSLNPAEGRALLYQGALIVLVFAGLTGSVIFAYTVLRPVFAETLFASIIACADHLAPLLWTGLVHLHGIAARLHSGAAALYQHGVTPIFHIWMKASDKIALRRSDFETLVDNRVTRSSGLAHSQIDQLGDLSSHCWSLTMAMLFKICAYIACGLGRCAAYFKVDHGMLRAITNGWNLIVAGVGTVLVFIDTCIGTSKSFAIETLIPKFFFSEPTWCSSCLTWLWRWPLVICLTWVVFQVLSTACCVCQSPTRRWIIRVGSAMVLFAFVIRTECGYDIIVADISVLCFYLRQPACRYAVSLQPGINHSQESTAPASAKAEKVATAVEKADAVAERRYAKAKQEQKLAEVAKKEAEFTEAARKQTAAAEKAWQEQKLAEAAKKAAEAIQAAKEKIAAAEAAKKETEAAKAKDKRIEDFKRQKDNAIKEKEEKDEEIRTQMASLHARLEAEDALCVGKLESQMNRENAETHRELDERIGPIDKRPAADFPSTIEVPAKQNEADNTRPDYFVSIESKGPKLAARSLSTKQFPNGVINKGSNIIFTLRDTQPELDSGSDSNLDSDSDLDSESEAEPDDKESVTLQPHDDSVDTLCTQLATLTGVGQGSKAAEAKGTKLATEQPVIRRPAAPDFLLREERVIPPSSTFGRRIEPSLETTSIPGLYQRGSGIVSTRPAAGVASREEWRNRLLGGPSTLTRLRRAQEDAESGNSNNGGDSGGPPGLPVTPTVPSYSGATADDVNGKSDATNDEDTNMDFVEKQIEILEDVNMDVTEEQSGSFKDDAMDVIEEQSEDLQDDHMDIIEKQREDAKDDTTETKGRNNTNQFTMPTFPTQVGGARGVINGTDDVDMDEETFQPPTIITKPGHSEYRALPLNLHTSPASTIAPNQLPCPDRSSALFSGDMSATSIVPTLVLGGEGYEPSPSTPDTYLLKATYQPDVPKTSGNLNASTVPDPAVAAASPTNQALQIQAGRSDSAGQSPSSIHVPEMGANTGNALPGSPSASDSEFEEIMMNAINDMNAASTSGEDSDQSDSASNEGEKPINLGNGISPRDRYSTEYREWSPEVETPHILTRQEVLARDRTIKPLKNKFAASSISMAPSQTLSATGVPAETFSVLENNSTGGTDGINILPQSDTGFDVPKEAYTEERDFDEHSPSQEVHDHVDNDVDYSSTFPDSDVEFKVEEIDIPDPTPLDTDEVPCTNPDHSLKSPDQLEPQLGDVWQLRKGETEAVFLPVYLDGEGEPHLLDKSEQRVFSWTPGEQWTFQDDDMDFRQLANIILAQTHRPEDPIIGQAWRSNDLGTSGKYIVAWSDMEQLYCITDKNHDSSYWDPAETTWRCMSNDEVHPVGFRQMTEADEDQESVGFEGAGHVPEEGAREAAKGANGKGEF